MQNKYHNKKVTYNGITFDSRKEAVRYQELILLQRAGEIHSLELQKEFELLPAIYEGNNGKKGKCIERAVKYKADFVYRDKDNFLIVEDVKGHRTKEYILKRKMMLFLKGIRIVEK
jgi:hypothetical protein